ncbi:MAG: hypothetical protein ACOWWH_13900 [Eubacteriaceae bacterium]
MEMCYDRALVMPSSCVIVNDEEMTYVQGGANGWWNSRRTIATLIDVALIVITAGQALASQAALKAFLKANKNKIAYQIRGKLMQKFAVTASSWIFTGINIALTVAGSSLGGMIAYGLDWADGNLNGYVLG